MKKLFLFITSAVFSSIVMANHTVQYDIRVDGITCPFCVATSEKELKKIDGVSAISSDLESGTISVCGSSSLVLEESQLRSLFLKKGFTYRSLSKTDKCSVSDGNLPSSELTHDEDRQHE